MSRQVLEYLRSRAEEMTADLEQVVRMETPSTNKGALDKLGHDLAERFKQAGAEVDWLRQDERGDHLRLQWAGQGAREEGNVLVLCHRDTVFEWGDIDKNPVRREHGRLYGPGAFDMKNGIVIFLWALRCMHELELQPRRSVVGLITADEEIGSGTSREAMETEARRAKATLVMEPALGERGALKTWRKGLGEYTLTVRGKAAHAGADPEQGASAIGELAEQVRVLHGLTDLKAGTTVNVGVIRGGSRPNVIAAHAEAVIDARTMTAEEGERLDRRIRALEPVHRGCTLQVTGGIERAPMMRSDATVALFQTARKLGRELGLDLEETGSGGVSDGNFTSGVGCPTLDGLGAVGDGAHTFDEYVVLSSLPERAALLVRLLQEV